MAANQLELRIDRALRMAALRYALGSPFGGVVLEFIGAHAECHREY
jgi:hypothetical protein